MSEKTFNKKNRNIRFKTFKNNNQLSCWIMAVRIRTLTIKASGWKSASSIP